MTAKNSNDLTNHLLVEIPKRLPNVRVWRRNVGSAYPGAVVRSAINTLIAGSATLALDVLRRARPVTFGLSGEPDLDGLCGPSGRRIGIEVKFGRDRMSEEQETCRRVYQDHGAVYIVARDVESAIAELTEELNK